VLTSKGRHDVTAPAGQHPELAAKWRENIAGLAEELNLAWIDRSVFVAVRDALVRNPGPDATFLLSYSRVYAQSQVMLVRRLADDDDMSRSLFALLERMKRNPAVITRTPWVADRMAAMPEPVAGDDALSANMQAALRAHHRAKSDAEFTRIAGPGECLDRATLQQDQVTLRADLAAVITYADNVVAHLDPTRDEHRLTFREIHDAIDRAGEMVNRYSAFLTGSWHAFENLALPPSWQVPLQRPVFEP
jgi:hypothetical protein